MCSGHGSEVMLSVGPWQQLIDVAIWMTVDDPGEDVSQIRERVDVIELTGLDQRGDGGPVFGATIRTCEQCILPIKRDGADGAFDGVVVELDAAIVDEARQAFQRDRV